LAQYILAKAGEVKLIDVSAFKPKVEGADALFPYKAKRKRISPRDLADIAHNLAVMQQSGLDILDSLATAIASSTSANAASLLYDVRQSVIGGSSLSAAFEEYKNQLPDVFLGVIRAGEQSGNLAQSFSSVEEFYRTVSKTKEGLNSQLIEPSITIVLSVGISLYLIGAIFPNFKQLASGMGVETLTGPINLFINLANYMPVLITVAVVAIVLFFRYREQIVLLLPVVGPQYKKLTAMLDTYAVSEVISIGFSAGLPLSTIVDFMKKSVGSKQYKKAMEKIYKDVEEVKPLSEAFADADVSPQLKAVVKIGERSGNIRKMADSLARTIVDSVDNEMEKMQRALFIGMTMLSAIIVAPILFAFYYGYFNIFQQLMHSL